MKKWILNTITVIDSAILMISMCMLDSESYIPLYVFMVAMMVMAVIIFRKEK